MSAQASIEVILRSSDGQDGERRFTLLPNTKMPIGRASKNSAKPELMVAQSNAYIDSPVISREHAILSADNTPPAPSVYITDNGSMHGTMVNQTKLEASKAMKLRNGDLLQFGQDVMRNETFYVARKYVFESSLPNDYSGGFSVPDGESSEEDMDADEVDDLMSARAPRYGSQTNPVNLDDFEEAPPAAMPEIIEIDDDDEGEEDGDVENETTMPADPAVSDDTKERIPSPMEERSPPSAMADRVSPAEALNGRGELAPARFALCDEPSSVEDDTESVYSSDDDDSRQGSSMSMSQGDNESDSNAEFGSELEASDDNGQDENEGDTVDAVRRMKMGAMLNDAQEQAILPDSPVAPRPSAPIGLPRAFGTSMPSASHASLRAPAPDMPAMESYMHPIGMFEDPFASALFGDMDSPLPPRPAAPRPGPWAASPYSIPYAPRDPNNLRMFEDFPPPMLMSSNTEFSPDLFDRYSGPSRSDDIHARLPSHQHQVLSENRWTPPKQSPANEAPKPTIAVNPDQTQTPSPVSSPPQPRRTKVSIPEIVDSPQQPPSPTPVPGNLKRKAAMFEADVLETASEPLSSPAAEPQAVSVPNPPATPTPERPIKRLRSRLGGAAKSMVTYVLPSAALTVALMSQLPDAFYTE